MNHRRRFVLDSIFQRNKKYLLYYENESIDDKLVEELFSNVQTDIAAILSLSSNFITHQGLDNFFTHHWSKLTLLNLNKNKISDKGCKNITKASMPQLRYLYLSNNQIGCVGLLHLSKGQWKFLQSLFLNGNYHQSKGIQSLTKTKLTTLKPKLISQSQ